ncbi:MAG: isoprenyl transferase [Desulfatibacillaceae bacterium]
MSSDQPRPTAEDYGLEPDMVPRHVAIIMDGNGRWAKKRLMNRVRGHEKGVETVRSIVRTSREIGVEVLTLYAFSTENWQRPRTEVTALMGILKRFLARERPEMMENGIRLNAIGQVERLPDDVRRVLDDTIRETDGNRDMVLNLALSYGGREEILRAARQLAQRAAAGELAPEAIDEATFSAHLYTAGMPDPDLMIRTSGEMRISNFLPWQLAYAEFHITPTLWPDFSRDEYISVIRDFSGRERRFGRTGDQLQE